MPDFENKFINGKLREIAQIPGIELYSNSWKWKTYKQPLHVEWKIKYFVEPMTKYTVNGSDVN